MPIPSQTDMFLVTLQQMKPGVEYTRRQIKNEVCRFLQLTPEEMQEKTNSKTPVYESRVGWAISWLNSISLVERVRRGVYRITSTGEEALAKYTSRSEFGDWVYQTAAAKKEVAEPEANTFNPAAPGDTSIIAKTNPEELIAIAEKDLHENLASELMAAIMDIPGREGDTFFEQIVTDLLEKMGYGEGFVTPPSNDHGIDGIIKTDPLGFDPIFIQAKRYSPNNFIGRPAIQGFAGALGSIKRGAFITTSGFYPNAIEYAKHYPNADIILIDGEKLVNLMIDFNLGVSPVRAIEIKRIDTDYFNREE